MTLCDIKGMFICRIFYISRKRNELYWKSCENSPRKYPNKTDVIWIRRDKTHVVWKSDLQDNLHIISSHWRTGGNVQWHCLDIKPLMDAESYI